MFKRTHTSNWLIAIMVLFFLSSCQKEVNELSAPQNDKTMKASDNIASLMMRTAMMDGSLDNVIDESSCASILLPVVVIVDGTSYTIEDETDISSLIGILENAEIPSLEIVFPVTVILPDYTEQTANNEQELDTLTAGCIEGGNDEDIECIDFKYPLSVAVLDTDFIQIRTVSLQNDNELYELFAFSNPGELFEFTFPMTLILANGTEQTVNDNIELEIAIENAINTCDEDDDNVYNDLALCDSEYVYNCFQECNWRVSSYNGSNALNGALLNFYGSHIEVTFENGDVIDQALWDVQNLQNGVELDLYDLPGSLSVLSGFWTFTECTPEQFVMTNDSNETIVLQRDCTDGDPIIHQLQNWVIQGEWKITNFIKDGMDTSAMYTNFIYKFNLDITVEATDLSTSVIEPGNWFLFEEPNLVKSFYILVAADGLIADIGYATTIEEYSENRFVLSGELLDGTPVSAIIEKI